ncbi:MAG: glycosyltransferase family 39 protein [Anaerolineales bacterium]|nr:glycosyltransferase family 39 protein [Anaerolineales bacterium]
MSVNFSQPNRIIILLAFVALLSLGLWLRLRFIHTVQLYPDEFVTLLAVQMIGQKGVPVMPSGLFYDHGLLYSYAGSVAAWFGPARLAVRYVSLAFGMLTLGAIFWLGRRWFSTAAGLIAVTGLAVAPAAIEWGSRARMYAQLQLLVLITLWLAYEGVSQNRAKWRWAALLTYLGATLTHFAAVALAPPLVLGMTAVWWNQWKRGGEDAKARNFSAHLRALASSPHLFIEIIALILILAIAFLVKRLGQPKGIEALDTGSVLPGLAQVFTIYSNFSLNPINGWQAIAPFYMTLPALIFAPFALFAVIRGLEGWKVGRSYPLSPAPLPLPPSASRWQSPALFLSLILLTTTLEMILFVSPDRRDDKYLFMLLPVLLLLGAQGMAWVGGIIATTLSSTGNQWPAITDDGHRRPTDSNYLTTPPAVLYLLSSILPLLISGFILVIAQSPVRALLANTGNNYDSAFAYVQTRWQKGDTILTGTPAAAAFYLGHNDFYGVQRRGGYDYRLLNINGQAVDRWLGSPAIRTPAELHKVLAQQSVWLVLERWGLQREYYDLPFQQQLLAQTDYVSETQGILILRSKADAQPLALDPAQPLEANFGNLVRLTGYTVEPIQPVPGAPLRLTLYWQALAPLPHDYTVFVHLRRPGGDTVAQADHRPLDNLYPTSLWPTGETIRESSYLSLPGDLPPGSYELWVGLYLLETGERLPLQNDTSGENALMPGVLQIE